MKALESSAGQQAKELSEVLFRSLGNNGRSILGTLHSEGFIKKVPTNQVLITPNSTSSVRLDELNKILNEMALGEDAVKRLEQLENDKGMTGKANKKKSTSQSKTTSQSVSGESNTTDVLSDSALASNFREQANKMIAEAKALMAESERLMQEAAQLDPVIPETNVKPKSTKTKKTADKVKAN